MKKIILPILIFTFFNIVTLNVNAQMPAPSGVEGMMGSSRNDNHTAREEAEGKAVWEKFTNKELTCADLSNDDFGVLGEYFMGQMMDDAHPTMNQMMIQMMGAEGEEQMHIVIGKRISGCDTAAAFPAGGNNWMSMMEMMGKQGTMPLDGMAGFGNFWFWIILVSILILSTLVWTIAGILAIIWLFKQIRKPKKKKVEENQ